MAMYIMLMPTLVEDYLESPTSSLVTVRCRPWHYRDRVALVGDAWVTVDRTVTLACDQPIQCRPAPGLLRLPKTGLRIPELWRRTGRRAPMATRQDLRCPCGSAYVRRSATHHSCQYCQRAWPNDEVPE